MLASDRRKPARASGRALGSCSSAGATGVPDEDSGHPAEVAVRPTASPGTSTGGSNETTPSERTPGGTGIRFVCPAGGPLWGRWRVDKIQPDIADAPMAQPSHRDSNVVRGAPLWCLGAPTGLRCDNPAGQQAGEDHGKLGTGLLTCYDTQTPTGGANLNARARSQRNSTGRNRDRATGRGQVQSPRIVNGREVGTKDGKGI